MNSRFCILALIAISSSGCALGFGRSLHQYSMLDNDASSGKPIVSEATQDVVVVTGDTEFADTAYYSLLEKCPHGRIVNVSARHSTNLGFFGYRNTLRLTGTCMN